MSLLMDAFGYYPHRQSWRGPCQVEVPRPMYATPPSRLPKKLLHCCSNVDRKSNQLVGSSDGKQLAISFRAAYIRCHCRWPPTGTVSLGTAVNANCDDRTPGTKESSSRTHTNTTRTRVTLRCFGAVMKRQLFCSSILPFIGNYSKVMPGQWRRGCPAEQPDHPGSRSPSCGVAGPS